MKRTILVIVLGATLLSIMGGMATTANAKSAFNVRPSPIRPPADTSPLTRPQLICLICTLPWDMIVTAGDPEGACKDNGGWAGETNEREVYDEQGNLIMIVRRHKCNDGREMPEVERVGDDKPLPPPRPGIPISYDQPGPGGSGDEGSDSGCDQSGFEEWVNNNREGSPPDGCRPDE